MTSSRQPALNTGAGNGIGRAIAIAMAENDRNVVCADIDSVSYTHLTLPTILLV